MDQYAVVGNPIAHSKSPKIHSEFAEQTQQQMSYTTLFSEEADFVKDLNCFFAGDGKGLNITVPFKLKAYEFADALSERAKQAGAVNTLVKKEQGIFGDNTDGIGLVNDLCTNQGVNLKQARILIIGAGGASRGVIGPLFEQAPASITIVNRTLTKAEDLAEQFAHLGKINAIGFEQMGSDDTYDVIVNASSAGLGGEAPALTPMRLENSFCYDMVYGKHETPFMSLVKSFGCKHSCDGLGMLVEQAAESFYLWRDIRPDTQALLTHLRAELIK